MFSMCMDRAGSLRQKYHLGTMNHKEIIEITWMEQPRGRFYSQPHQIDPRLVAGKHTNTLWEMNTVSTVDTIRNVEMSQVLQNIGSTLETRRPTEIRDGNFESLEDDTNGPSEEGEDRLIEGNDEGATEGTADFLRETRKDAAIEGKGVENGDNVGLILGTTDRDDV